MGQIKELRHLCKGVGEEPEKANNISNSNDLSCTEWLRSCCCCLSSPEVEKPFASADGTPVANTGTVSTSYVNGHWGSAKAIGGTEMENNSHTKPKVGSTYPTTADMGGSNTRKREEPDDLTESFVPEVGSYIAIKPKALPSGDQNFTYKSSKHEKLVPSNEEAEEISRSNEKVNNMTPAGITHTGKGNGFGYDSAETSKVAKQQPRQGNQMTGLDMEDYPSSFGSIRPTDQEDNNTDAKIQSTKSTSYIAKEPNRDPKQQIERNQGISRDRKEKADLVDDESHEIMTALKTNLQESKNGGSMRSSKLPMDMEDSCHNLSN